MPIKKINSELKNAFDKELSLIKNDLYYQEVEVFRDSKRSFIRYDVMYKPLEILTGDSYSIRRVGDDKIVFFLLDAMGKGISASITAMTSTTLLNYIFDQMKVQKNFEFKRWVKRFVDYIKGDLLENEMLSIILTSYNKKDAFFEYASFGMPAFLFVDEKNNLIKIKSNNPPISLYSDDFKIDGLNVKKIKKALFYTDGLCENRLKDGTFYKDKMYEDFIKSNDIVDFKNFVNKKIDTKNDDLAFIHIDTATYESSFITKTLFANMESIDNALLEISDYLSEVGLNSKLSSQILLAMSELLNNALEHGVFKITNLKKSYLIENGLYDDELKRLESLYKDKSIKVKYMVKNYNNSRVFIARIEDFGDGFDVRKLKNLVVEKDKLNGRGILIVKKLVDRLYYNEAGNSVTIKKYI